MLGQYQEHIYRIIADSSQIFQDFIPDPVAGYKATRAISIPVPMKLTVSEDLTNRRHQSLVKPEA